MLQFPIKVLFVAFILLGIGGGMANSALAAVIPANEATLLMSSSLQYVGSFMINNFPLLLVVSMVGRRKDSSAPIFAGVMGYIIFIIVSTFIVSQAYSSEFYASILGISVNMAEFSVGNETVLYPFQTGVISAIVVVWCTRMAYRNTRQHSMDGWMGYVDKDTMAVLIAMVFCFIAAIVMAIVWPVAINIIARMMSYIARDITSPIRLFIYGVFDRAMSILGLSSISHGAFWFGNYGGSWINANGVSFFGDVSIWTGQQTALIVSNGAGRLITPYYLINFFAIPAIAIVNWFCFTDYRERRRYFFFMVLVILVSVAFGSILPFELYLLTTTPVLLAIHLLTTGLLFGILQSLGVFIGYTYSGSQAFANPGNIFDLIAYFNDTYTRGNLYLFLIVGGVVFIFYFLVAYLYYNYLALDFLNFGKREIVDEFLGSIGGLGNVRNIQASTTRVTVKVINPQIVDFNRLHATGVGKIVENKDGYNIYFGSDSRMIRRAVIRKIRGK